MNLSGWVLGYDPNLKTPQPWVWVPHPEVWVMIAALVVMYLYATRVIGPRAVPAGEPIITRSQSRWYFSGLGVLWVAADWPMHDLAEDYLYSIHMIQHLLLTWVVPPMMLMAMPEWLARLILGKGRAYQAFRIATLPLVAGLVYNALFAVSHSPTVVNDSVRSSSIHFLLHLGLVLTAILMWNCICGPLKELRISLPMQCVYLFFMGIIPTIPAAWLVFAQGVVYKSYVHPWGSFWGLTATGDQQLAGFLMKFVGGLYLGSIIIALFFRWARQDSDDDDPERRERDLVRIADFRARTAHLAETEPEDESTPLDRALNGEVPGPRIDHPVAVDHPSP